MLNRFCLLSKSPQNQKKNKCSFYTAFQVLDVLLRKICRIHPLIFYFLFLLAFTSADIIFHNFLERHSTLSEKKKIFATNYLFLTDSLKPPSTAHLLNNQNPLSATKFFCQCFLTYYGFSSILCYGDARKNWDSRAELILTVEIYNSSFM